MSTNLMDRLQCPVCFHEFNCDDRVPLVLYCGHSFCLGCIQSMDRRMGAIICPHCRNRDYRGVSHIKKNILLLQTFSTHHRNPMAPCAEHSSVESMFFCLTELKPFCSRCVTRHKGHDFYDIDDPIITAGTDEKLCSLRTTFEQQLKTDKEQRDYALNILDKVENKKRSARDSIDRLFEPLYKAIEDRKNYYYMNLNTPCNFIIRKLQQKVEHLDEHINKRQKLMVDLEDMTRKMNKMAGQERLKLAKELEALDTEFEDSNNIQIDDIDKQVDSLDLKVDLNLEPIIQSVMRFSYSSESVEAEFTWAPQKLPPPPEVEANPQMVELVTQLINSGITMSDKIKQVVQTTDRREFMPEESEPYEDRPQRIGFNTTISAPHMHVMTLGLLEPWLKPGMKVLDVGCGSGYLTVCMAKMIERGKVYGVDHIEELINQAVENIMKSHSHLLHNDQLEVIFITRDGRQGLSEHGQFDVIHVGAATPEVPKPLVDSLAPGGVLIAPVGSLNGFQRLSILKKDEGGNVSMTQSIGVNYAPLTDRERQCPGY
jgi:protein-L-isoaspartate(D-aspartate) O-methyltransferase